MVGRQGRFLHPSFSYFVHQGLTCSCGGFFEDGYPVNWKKKKNKTKLKKNSKQKNKKQKKNKKEQNWKHKQN